MKEYSNNPTYPDGDAYDPCYASVEEAVIDEIANWIDTQVIAQMIVEHLGCEGEEVTVENCKQTWYRVLEHIGGNIGFVT